MSTHQAGRQHDTLLTAGQTAGGIREILPVAEIMRQLMAEAEAALAGLRSPGRLMAIVLQETLRGAFYAPFYAALALDAYREEGVDVRFASAPRPTEAARGLAEGTVDVTWGGPMRVMLTYEQNPSCDLVCFCEVVTRDPFFLIGRAPAPTSSSPI